MPRPAVHPATEAIYGRLPEMYRAADAREDWPLLRYLSLLGDQAGETMDLVERIDYVAPDAGGDEGDTSDLADPLTADIEWLDWLGQHVGVVLDPKLTDDERRDAVLYGSSGWRAGTKTAVADAAKTVLTGTKYARVYDHATTRADAGTQTAWDVLIVTRPTETPDVALVLATVVDKKAKPAAVKLHHEAYAATWALLATSRPTWADWHAAGSWRNLEETI